jgi:methyltransferase (TIGR00027 family)
MQPDRPSSTAALIARSLVCAARRRGTRGLVGSHSVACALGCLRAEGRDGWRWWRLCGDPVFQRLLAWCERRILPGIVLHYALRKRAIQVAVDRALGAGCETLVVLAAGFDALAWRTMRRHPQVMAIEIDHPATQMVKRRAFARTAPQPEFQAIDLGTHSPVPCLPAGRATVVVAEGLLMYFEEDRVRTLLGGLAAALAPGSVVVFTCMCEDRHGHLGFPAGHPLIGRWLRRQREVFRWGVPRARLGWFLASVGLRLVAHDDATALARRFLAGRARGAAGEDVVVAVPMARAA